MDKNDFKVKLLDLVRQNIPFENRAKITCLINIKIEDSNEVINLDISEEIFKGNGVKSELLNGSQTKSSKRKSVAPQKMIPTGDDSFVLTNTSKNSIRSSSGLEESSFDLSSSFTDQEAPLNLSRNSSPQDFKPMFDSSTSTPLKKELSAFQINNPGPHSSSVFPTFGNAAFPFWAYYNAAAQQTVMNQSQRALELHQLKENSPILPKPEVTDYSKPTQAKIKRMNHKQPQAIFMKSAATNGVNLPMPSNNRTTATTGLVAIRTGGNRKGPNKTFPCNQCTENFNTLTLLSKHTYEQHKGYKCTFCGANFTQRSNLQRHSLKHVGFKPFECRVCKKSYYRKDHLVRHIEVTHPGNDPKLNIDTKLSSAECLEFLEKMQTSGDTSDILDASRLDMDNSNSSKNGDEEAETQRVPSEDEVIELDDDNEEGDDIDADDPYRLKIIMEGSQDSMDCSETKEEIEEDIDVESDESDFVQDLTNHQTVTAEAI